MMVLAKVALFFLAIAFAAMGGMFAEEKLLTKTDRSSEAGFCLLAAFFLGFIATFL